MGQPDSGWWLGPILVVAVIVLVIVAGVIIAAVYLP